MRKILVALAGVTSLVTLWPGAAEAHEAHIKATPTCTGYDAAITTTQVPTGVTVATVELWGNLKGELITETGIHASRQPGTYSGGINLTFSDGTTSSPTFSVTVVGGCDTTTTTIDDTPDSSTQTTLAQTTTTATTAATTTAAPVPPASVTGHVATSVGDATDTSQVTLPRTGAQTVAQIEVLGLPMWVWVCFLMLFGAWLIIKGRSHGTHSSDI